MTSWAAERVVWFFVNRTVANSCSGSILKYSLHPILKKLGLEQGGFNIFRRFRITELETAEVPAALQHTWSGHAKSHVSEVYKKLLKQREWRLAMGRKSRNRLYAARPPAGIGEGLKWKTWQTFAIPKSRLSCLESGGREGIRTPGLLVANSGENKLSQGATIT